MEGKKQGLFSIRIYEVFQQTKVTLGKYGYWRRSLDGVSLANAGSAQIALKNVAGGLPPRNL